MNHHNQHLINKIFVVPESVDVEAVFFTHAKHAMDEPRSKWLAKP